MLGERGNKMNEKGEFRLNARVHLFSLFFKSLFLFNSPILKGTAGVHAHAFLPHLRLRSRLCRRRWTRESMSQVLVLVTHHLHLQFSTSIPSS